MHDLLLEREGRAPLVGQRRVGHRPSAIEVAHEVVAGHEHRVEEHLVELGLGRHGDQRADLDARRLHVDHQVGDPTVPRRVGVGAHEGDPPLRVLGVARPDLLAVDQPPVAHIGGPGGEPGQVRARPRLAEELAPDLLGVEDPGQPTPLLLLRAVGQQGRPGQVDAGAVDGLGGAGAGVLHVEDGHLDRRGVAAAVGVGPVDAHPAVTGQAGLPPPSPLELLVERRERRCRLDVGVEPSSDLVAEGDLVVGQGQVHGSSRATPRAPAPGALIGRPPPGGGAGPGRACQPGGAGPCRGGRPVRAP